MKNARKVTRKMKKEVLVLGLTIGMVISPLNVHLQRSEPAAGSKDNKG